MKKMTMIFGIMALMNLVSCAHHRDVRPGVDGIHRVVVKSDDHDEATRDAIAQANHVPLFC